MSPRESVPWGRFSWSFMVYADHKNRPHGNFSKFLIDLVTKLLYNSVKYLIKRSTKWGAPPKGCYLFCAFFCEK